MDSNRKPGLDLRLETAAGDCFLRSEAIVFVSAPYQKKKYAESRTIALEGGHRIFCLNSDANINALRESGVGGLIPAPESKPARKPRKAGQQRRKAGPTDRDDDEQGA